MRLLVSNPDNLGDFVLRLPLYRALSQAGWQLMLLTRPLVAPLAAQWIDGAQIHVIHGNPYRDEPQPEWFEQLIQEVRNFAPARLLVAPWQWTLFDLRLIQALADIPSSGLNGPMYRGDPRDPARLDTLVAQRAFTDVITVDEGLAEIHKNQRLAQSLLQSPLADAVPAIDASPAQLQAAECYLAANNIRPGEYLLACVGNDPYNAVRNWSESNWSTLLSHWIKTYQRKVILVGSPTELPASRAIFQQIDPAQRPAAILDDHHLPLDTLIGLLALCDKYVGRDSGPMHLAAALDKPVFALFGGGHWPRFVPAARRGRVLTLPLPCVGCDWICHLQCSHCIKSIPTSQAMQAADELERQIDPPFAIRGLAPDAPLWALMHQEAADTARRLMLQSSDQRRELAEATDGFDRQIQALRGDWLEAQSRLNHAAAQHAEQLDRQQALHNLLGKLPAEHAQSLDRERLLSDSLRQSQSQHQQALDALELLQKQMQSTQQHVEILTEQLHHLAASRWLRLGHTLRINLPDTPAPAPESRP